MDGILELFVIFCAVILRDDYGAAGGQSGKQADQGIHDRSCTADCSERLRTDKITDDYAVNSVVKLLKKVADQKGNGEQNYFFNDRTFGH